MSLSQFCDNSTRGAMQGFCAGTACVKQQALSKRCRLTVEVDMARSFDVRNAAPRVRSISLDIRSQSHTTGLAQGLPSLSRLAQNEYLDDVAFAGSGRGKEVDGRNSRR
eukprot:m.128491 g.128491  ORF g.128491 m.128491 type:complete len:109 (-) comp13626_c1_seq1:379-705(-)